MDQALHPRPSLRTDRNAVAPAIGLMVMFLTTAALAGGTYLAVRPLADQDADFTASAVRFEPTQSGSGLEVALVSGDAVRLSSAEFRITANGVVETYPLSYFADHVDDGATWTAGEALCIVGDGPGCLMLSATDLDVQLVSGTSLLFENGYLLRPFEILGDGSIRALCTGPVEVDVVGVQITYGRNGPDIPVYVDYSRDGGSTYAPLFGGSAVQGGQRYTDELVPAGTVLGVRGTADGYGFHASYTSMDSDPHVLVLKDGDAVPSIPAFGSQAAVETFLQPYVDVDSGVITLDSSEAILLYEFNPNVNSSAADFQDLVVKFGFSGAHC